MRMAKIPQIAGFVFYSFCASWIWVCLGLGLFYSVTGQATLDRWDLITVPPTSRLGCPFEAAC